MGKVVQVRGIKIGEGIPKICVPIVEKSMKDILEEAFHIKELPIDIVEWRVDWFIESDKINKVLETAKELRQILKEKPILFTFRTKEEGGNKGIALEEYTSLYEAIIQSGYVDFVDVELFRGDKIVEHLVEYAHQNQCKIVASNHDFYNTPSKDEIISRLLKMKELGADIPKIAVMPNEVTDVLRLLESTNEVKEVHNIGPVVTMSMGKTGGISRLSGELFGSAITFASAKQKSAPGQIPVKELHVILNSIHNNMFGND
jgi:3-dehydroquinate dehydratase-1